MDRLWAIEVFVRVVECGSFNKAAESLDLANATVTGCIRNLEKYLDVTLIQRNTRFLHLTEEGKLFFDRGVRLLKDAAGAEAEVRSRVNEIAGTVRVEVPVAIGHELLTPTLHELSERYPKLEVAMILTNDPRNIIERGTDVAVRMDAVDDADLVARLLCQARYVVCASPAFLKAHGTPESPAELDPRHCLGVLTDGRYAARRWKFTGPASDVDFDPRGPVHFNSSHSLVDSALRGLGMVYLLDVYVRHHIAAGELVRLFPDWHASSRTFYAVTPKSRFVPPKVRAFIEYLNEVFQREEGFTRPAGLSVGLRSSRHRTRGAGAAAPGSG